MRQRAKRNPLIEHMLEFYVTARNRIAHDDQVRTRLQIVNSKWLGYGDAEEVESPDIGGYEAASDPVTRNPRCCSIPASEAIAVPQIPIR